MKKFCLGVLVGAALMLCAFVLIKHVSAFANMANEDRYTISGDSVFIRTDRYGMPEEIPWAGAAVPIVISGGTWPNSQSERYVDFGIKIGNFKEYQKRLEELQNKPKRFTLVMVVHHRGYSDEYSEIKSLN